MDLKGLVDNLYALDPIGCGALSVVIPTRNRCPEKRPDKNPLFWSINSILNERAVKQIVVVDDASQDYTKQTIETLQQLTDKEIKYVRNTKRQRAARSRNKGVMHATESRVAFLDDDCVLITPGGLDAVAALDYELLACPIYLRSRYPKGQKPMAQIAQFDYGTGLMLGGFDHFPIEYVQETEKRIREGRHELLPPFRIQNLHGFFLAKREIMENYGFRDMPWSNCWGEETFLALELQQRGYEIVLCPDPRAATVHLRFGWSSPDQTEDGYLKTVGYPLADLIEPANTPNFDTGYRTAGSAWAQYKIAAQYHITAKMDSETAYLEYLKSSGFDLGPFGDGVTRDVVRRGSDSRDKFKYDL
jgi:hypothetical protein